MFLCFTQHATAEESEKVVSGKKTSDGSSLMIEIAYNPTFVPMDLDDFEDDFEEIEDNDDYEEYSDSIRSLVF